MSLAFAASLAVLLMLVITHVIAVGVLRASLGTANPELFETAHGIALGMPADWKPRSLRVGLLSPFASVRGLPKSNRRAVGRRALVGASRCGRCRRNWCYGTDRVANMRPNNALHSNAGAPRRFPRSVLSLGADERGR